ncbi:6-phosphogluconolactonase [uncultured Algimonas sp.]|uniref:6-phosphogluconolactonase n=1 Tax=uncultured Algimonas sp. TaxID=1547920 RepID=UPI0026222358|nr:6-phosphogluconolactonase [uncultured Algimonas sp.]
MTEAFLRYFSDLDDLVHAATAHLSGTLAKALDARGRASLMLSGGSSPEPVYRRLAQEPLAWDGVGVGLVDERWVPRGHPASNADFVQNCFEDSPADRALFVPLHNGHERAAEGLEAAEQALALLAQPFDICVMGMGLDGHTASWFPRSMGLDAALDADGDARVAAVDARGCEGAGEITQRMTLTFAAVAAARHTVLLLSSWEKLDVFRAAADLDVRDAPVKALLSLGDRLTVFALEIA